MLKRSRGEELEHVRRGDSRMLVMNQELGVEDGNLRKGKQKEATAYPAGYVEAATHETRRTCLTHVTYVTCMMSLV